MRELTTRSYTPVFVFLDASGKKVLETAGFRDEREARALHEFVSKRHYQKTTWPSFLKARSGGVTFRDNAGDVARVSSSASHQ